MTERDKDAAARYYMERYEVIAAYDFVARPMVKLYDHPPKDEKARRCRFCRLGSPEVSFKMVAHAAPEFLGNKAIRSMNECDLCNQVLGREYEDHLGRWSQLGRSAAQVKGKKGAPTYINPASTMRIENKEGRLVIHLTDKEWFAKLQDQNGPFTFTLPADATSPTYVPLRAAKALVKVACSICPLEELHQCQRAIDWLMNRIGIRVSNFPVLYGFTPGPPDAFKSKVILLRRKHLGREPYLWCVVQYLNHRLQVFVPFCPIDDPLFLNGDAVSIPTWHYRLPDIAFDWPFGPSEYFPLDWSSEEETQSSPTASFHLIRAEVVNRKNP